MDTVEVVVTQAGVDVTVCTVDLVGRPAREALEELARLSLAAQRCGHEVELRGPGARCLASLLGIDAGARDDDDG